MTGSRFYPTCPACDGVGTVIDWQPENIEHEGVDAYEIERSCELCNGFKTVTAETLADWERAMIGGQA